MRLPAGRLWAAAAGLRQPLAWSCCGLDASGSARPSPAFSCQPWCAKALLFFGFCSATCRIPFGFDGTWRRHRRNPAKAAQPAGKDPRERNGSTVRVQ
jgi:hypothetical protein